MEPQVSVPIAKAASPAAVIAPEPLEEPQVQWSVFQGFLAAPVAEAIRLVESDAARRVRLQDLAASAGMSKYHFLRVFRRLTGMTPYQYLLSARMRRAALELARSVERELPAGSVE